MRHFLIGNSKNIVKDSFIWNAVAGMLDAGQSALLLIAISRTNPVQDAGIFSIAYAIACLAATVGKWGMRNFQATDVQGKYSYSTYVSSRIVTCVLMVILVFLYIFKGAFTLDYTFPKCVVIFLISLLKLIDTIEDVVHGMFQRKGRLDVGAKCMATRYILVLTVCILFLCWTHNLVVSLGIACIVSAVYFILTTSIVYGEFKEKVLFSISDRNLWRLLIECFSLFAGSFLMIYIANAPKYAIDEYMDENVQACFNYIFMPVYVISILNMFIYQPVLTRLAVYYQDGKQKEFLRLFFKQMLMVVVLAIAVLLGGFSFGIPILSFFYNIDLSGYKVPLMILLTGGSFLAISGYLSVVVTIIRKQNWLMVGYVLVAAITFFAAKPFVYYKGTIGASVLYTGSVFLQVIIFALIFIKFFIVNPGNQHND